jgi:hypothetical protein
MADESESKPEGFISEIKGIASYYRTVLRRAFSDTIGIFEWKRRKVLLSIALYLQATFESRSQQARQVKGFYQESASPLQFSLTRLDKSRLNRKIPCVRG